MGASEGQKYRQKEAVVHHKGNGTDYRNAYKILLTTAIMAKNRTPEGGPGRTTLVSAA